MSTSVDLADELADRIRRQFPNRALDQFVNDAVAECLARIEQRETDAPANDAEFEASLAAAYAASRAEQVEIDQDWEPVSIDDWPNR